MALFHAESSLGLTRPSKMQFFTLMSTHTRLNIKFKCSWLSNCGSIREFAYIHITEKADLQESKNKSFKWKV